MSNNLPALLGGPPAFPDGLPLVRPWVPDIPGIGRRIEAVLASGRLTVGPLVRELEEQVAECLGVEHVVAVASCTSGLMLVLQALGATGPVVLPSFTFSASAHAVVWAGGRPAFADIEPESLTLDPEAAAAAAADGAVALMATHVFGTPCAVERLQAVADEAGLPLVYDAAHALGSRRRGVPVGRFGIAEVFSLSPTKVVVAGEGGLVATGDAGLAEACRLGRDYGNPGNYDCRFPGLNARMSELHAAVALASFADLDERVAHRNALVEAFKATTAGLPGLSFPSVEDADVSTYKDLTLLVNDAAFGLTAKELGRALRVEGIDCRHYYAPPVHRQRAYAGVTAAAPLPVTERVVDQVLTPPLWSHMERETVRQVAEAVVRLQERSVEVRKRLAQGAEGLGG